MHDQAAAKADERRAEVVRRAMLATLWDAKAGAFLLNTEDPQPNHTQDAQVAPVAYGVISGKRARSALRFVGRNLETRYGPMNGEYDADPYMSNYISPYISGVQMLTHFERGETAKGYDLMRRMFGHMVDTDPNTTFWEKLAPDGDTASYTPLQAGNDQLPSNVGTNRGFASLGHSWSASGGPALSMYTLGIRPTAPGFSHWIVAPQPGDLRWAQGQVPTPAGPIVSRWKRGAGGRSFVLTVSAPASTKGAVAVPELGSHRAIAMDGRRVWNRGRPAPGVSAEVRDGAVVFEGIGGRHTFASG
jgi:alpha-L-rhamnosidase